jgi:carbon-monoxide dehydrogenase large subunit
MYVGQSIKRREDNKYLTGTGQFVDDVALSENIAHAAYVRSPHPHAKIVSISTERALAMPGVLAVLTGKDWTDSGYGEAESVWPVKDMSGAPSRSVNRPFLAIDRVVRYVGECVAMVVAEDRYVAMDAAEAVDVQYEAHPANTVTAKALDAGTPLVHPTLGTNMVLETTHGDKDAMEAAFTVATHVTECVVPTNRVTAASIEPRSYLGHYDAHKDYYTLWAATQSPHLERMHLAVSLQIPEHKCRVIAPDVGGGFGMKLYHYPEEPTVLWASKIVGRPVRWTGTRSEALVSDTHARDHHTLGRIAFDADGKILAMSFETLAAFGAYESQFQASISNAYHFALLSCGYDVAAIHTHVKGVYTHTTPVDAYRGAGRPEAVYQVERLIENGAKELGIDALDLREQNLIPTAKFPYQTAVGITYDVADLPALYASIREMSRYPELRAEQTRLREAGTLMGIGSCCFFDMAGAGPVKMMNSLGAKIGCYDVASVRVHPSGKITVFAGSHSHGQAHETTWLQIAADRLGCHIDDLELVEGDTDRVPFGIGTWGSRSLSTAGMAVAVASDKITVKAKTLAAHMLECAADDIEIAESMFSVKGTDRGLSYAEVADAAYHRGDRPEGLEIGLEETHFYDPTDCNYPSAIHICVVLIDADTGGVTLRDYWAVDDVGTIVNPMVVKGQIHGGLVQGIGQALMEECLYDAGSGQYISGTFMDYAMPRAGDIPALGVGTVVTAAPSNPLGIKGAGESGTIGAPACVSNGVIDALWHLGVRQITQPMTPKKIWRAIHEAQVQ